MARERANSIYEYLRYDTKNRMFVDFFWGSLEKVAKCTALLYVLQLFGQACNSTVRKTCRGERYKEKKIERPGTNEKE